jgi:very-short-patch-repair endonuclease
MEIKNLKKRSEVKFSYRPEVSDSNPERDLFHEILLNGFRAERQYPLSGFFVDMAFPEYRLAVEYDGKEFHQNKAEDEERERVIRRSGWDVIRVQNYHGFMAASLNGTSTFESTYSTFDTRMSEVGKYIGKILEARKIRSAPHLYAAEKEALRSLSKLSDSLKGWYQRLENTWNS